MLQLFAIGVGGGALLGGATNVINGAISPEYFLDHRMLFWKDWDHIRLCAVVEGIIEGAGLGSVYAAAFVALTWAVAARRCHFSAAVGYIRTCILIALGAWIAGGVCGLAYAYVWPFDFQVRTPPRFFLESLAARYEWVHGSILAVYFGCVVPIAAVIIYFVVRNRLDFAR